MIRSSRDIEKSVPTSGASGLGPARVGEQYDVSSATVPTKGSTPTWPTMKGVLRYARGRAARVSGDRYRVLRDEPGTARVRMLVTGQCCGGGDPAGSSSSTPSAASNSSSPKKDTVPEARITVLSLPGAIWAHPQVGDGDPPSLGVQPSAKLFVSPAAPHLYRSGRSHRYEDQESCVGTHHRKSVRKLLPVHHSTCDGIIHGTPPFGEYRWSRGTDWLL